MPNIKKDAKYLCLECGKEYQATARETKAGGGVYVFTNEVPRGSQCCGKPMRRT